MVEKIGLQAVLDTKQYNKGLSEYVDGLGAMNKETATTSKAINKAGDVIGAGLAATATAAAVATAAIVAGVVAVGAAVTKLAIQAAPLEGIGQAFSIMAGNAGLALEDLRTAAAGTISDFELMRSANIALTGAGQELAKEFGENLPALLEAARAASKATGKDVGFLFESLVGGVKRSAPLLIDNTGLVLKLGEANQALADELGITVQQLTAEQKQIALLNATVAAGAVMTEQLGSDQLNAAENMARLRAQTKNIVDTIGLAFTPALNTVVGALADFATRISDALREGGLLQNMLVRMGAIASLVADGLAMLIQKALPAVTNFIGEMGISFSDAAENAFQWGVDIAVSLADGLIKGASAALTAAMNFIGNLLTSWLAPGSPPRVAPQLDKWGAAALTSWLEGMTEANFDILKKVQGPLKSILDPEKFKGVTGGLIEALGTGDMSAFFDQVAKAGGEFGNEIVDLAQKQLALASAVDTVAKAEEDLAQARKDQINATSKVSELTAQYNELLRDNADPAILEAQLAQINAAEDQAKAAALREQEAQKTLESTEGEIGVMEEQLSLQEQLVNQLLGLADTQKDAAAAAGAAPAGGAGAGIGAGLGAGLGAAIEAGMPDIGQLLGDKIAEAKEMLLKKVGELLEPIKKKFNEEWKPIFEELAKKWEWFTGIVEQFWNEKIKPIQQWAEEHVLKPLGRVWQFILNDLLPTMRSIGSVVWQFVRMPFRLLGSLINDVIIPALTSVWEWLGEKLPEVMEDLGIDVDALKEKLDTFKANTVDALATGFENIKAAIGKVKQKLDDLAERLRTLDVSKLWAFIGQSPSPLEIGLRGISRAMEDMSRQSFPQFATQMSLLPAVAGGAVTVNNDFGGNNISSGMDMSMFETRVLGIVDKAIRTSIP